MRGGGCVPDAIVVVMVTGFEAGGTSPGRSITQRMEERGERLHISIGAVCNNNCIFCMEEDREARYVNNSAMTRERVRWVLDHNRGAEEVCFTSGEPTTRSELPEFIRWAKASGYPKISLMTNGRRLSHRPYAIALVRSGLNRVYVSIHGHTAKLHEGLTRTPESFGQTVAGIDAAATLKRYGVELHTSTVVTKRNLPHLPEIYAFLRAHGVDQVVFNVMQANGRAHTHFDRIFPRYTEIAATFRRLIETSAEERPMAFLVDIPLCTTEGIPDFNRGFVERYRHFEPHPAITAQEDAAAPLPHEDGKRHGLTLVTREDLDTMRRDKRDECRSCRYEDQCEGVWRTYVERYGWDEMAPIV